jgi:hypothetical protein
MNQTCLPVLDNQLGPLDERSLAPLIGLSIGVLRSSPNGETTLLFREELSLARVRGQDEIDRDSNEDGNGALDDKEPPPTFEPSLAFESRNQTGRDESTETVRQRVPPEAEMISARFSLASQRWLRDSRVHDSDSNLYETQSIQRLGQLVDIVAMYIYTDSQLLSGVETGKNQ